MRIVKRRLFGASYIRLGSFLVVSSLLYETGAILGRARSDKLALLAKVFPADPGKEESFINELQKEARKRLEEYKSEFKEEPSSFIRYFYLIGIKKLGLDPSDTPFKTLKKAFAEKGPIIQFGPYIRAFGLQGVGFGSLFPQLTEKMYRNAYQSDALDVWSEAKAHGLSIPKEFIPMNFEEQEKAVLKQVATFVSGYYPELLDPLDLRGYLPP